MTTTVSLNQYVRQHPMEDVSSVARRYGVPRSQVYRAREKAGLPKARDMKRVRRARRASRLIDWVIEKRIAGYPDIELFRQFNLSNTTFHRALEEWPYLDKRWRSRYQLMESTGAAKGSATIEHSTTSAAQEGERTMATNGTTGGTLRSFIADWVSTNVEPGERIPTGSLVEASGSTHKQVLDALAGMNREEAWDMVERQSRGSYRRTPKEAADRELASTDNGRGISTGDLFEAVGILDDGDLVVRHEGDHRLYRLVKLN
jgi:hypothetical protein